MPEGRDGEQVPDAALAAPGAVHSQSGIHTVFISYASSDRAVADSVCAALERAGVNCWIAPRDVTPGELYSEAIVHAIDSAKVVVLVLSQNAAVSQHVLREVERASSKRHPVVSFRIDLAPLPAALEYFLNTSQWLDASAIGVEPALPKLVHAVQRGVAHASDAATSPSAGARSAARTEPDAAVTGQARQRSRLMLAALAAITAFALAYLVVDQFWLSKRVDEQKPSGAATPTSPSNPSVAQAIPDKSIAVLPFADMSAEKNQEYMADGIAEELLNLLAQAPDLKVIARTSSFAFKGQNLEIAEIAKKLNVAHILEGSVRTSGKQIRITAQLVRSADSTHLWSEKYDRSVDDIFAVQDEIANEIVQALQIRLAGGTISRREGGTNNLEAYQLYLRAATASSQSTKASLDAAQDYLKRATKIDPLYGRAWSRLARVVWDKALSGYVTTQEGYESTRKFARHALEISPHIAEAHALLADLYINENYDWAAAEIELQQALDIDPNDPYALMIAAIRASVFGQHEDAYRLSRAALERDPFNTLLIAYHGENLYRMGRFAEAEGHYRSLVDRQPASEYSRVYIGKALLAQGKPAAALSMVQQEISEEARMAYLPVFLQAAGRNTEADAALKAQLEYWGAECPACIARTYAYRGEHEIALEWLERAYQQKDSSLINAVHEPLYGDLADDPRFKTFLRNRLKLPV